MKFPMVHVSLAVSYYLTMVAVAAAVDNTDNAVVSTVHERTPALRGNDADNSSVDSDPQRELYAPVLATIYEHHYYQGRSIKVSRPGYYGIDFLLKARFNDIASSIQVAPGYAVQLCIDDGCYNPNDFSIAGSTNRFGPDINDKLSSFFVYQPAAVLYEDAHYGGRGLVVPEPGYFNIDLFYQNHFNDLASSMIVAPDFEVLLCLDADFVECQHEALVGSIPWFEHFNDQVSSIIVSDLIFH